MRMLIYTYIYIYIYIYIYTDILCIYIYIEREREIPKSSLGQLFAHPTSSLAGSLNPFVCCLAGMPPHCQIGILVCISWYLGMHLLVPWFLGFLFVLVFESFGYIGDGQHIAPSSQEAKQPGSRAARQQVTLQRHIINTLIILPLTLPLITDIGSHRLRNARRAACSGAKGAPPSRGRSPPPRKTPTGVNSLL